MGAKTSVDKHRRVLSAAEAVFLRQGYGSTTMGDLAAAAGMSRPALYLVYSRKHELFSAIIQDDSPCTGTERVARSETDSLQHWMTWVCDLWLGEAFAQETGRPAPLIQAQPRHENSHRESAFLQSILQEGLSKRLPCSAEPAVCASVARLLTFCVGGLLDSRVGQGERKALLAVQIDALAEAALRPDETAPREVVRRPFAPAVRKSQETARALGAG